MTLESMILAESNVGYYATAFPKYQQKNISGFLTMIWQSDPFKAKWSILAKAYSVIRDHQGKDNAPLDQFLAITGPLIGIIKPEHYLQTMGWEIAMKPDGQTIMNRYGVDLAKHLFTTNLSVNDIIRHCHHQEFFVGSLTEVLSSENEAVMTMATSVQRAPAAPVGHVQGHDAQLVGNTDTGSVGEEMHSADVQGIAAGPAHDANPTSNENEGTDEINDMSGGAHDASAAPEIFVADISTAVASPAKMATNATPKTASGTNNPGPEFCINPNGNMEVMQQLEIDYAAMNPASGLAAANFQLASEYPFNVEFDPNLSSFIFDPFQGYQFDAFDMSDLNWTDVIDFDACS